MKHLIGIVALAGALTSAGTALAQTVKIGVVNTYTGVVAATFGEFVERAMRLYMKLNPDKLPPGVKVELNFRDDGGPNPEKAKQLAQELIVRDKVQLLTGMIATPNALAIAPLATEAKMPTMIMNAGGSVITTRSPYMARVSFTLWQSAYPLGQWAAKKYKKSFILVSDYSPGHDAEEAFSKSFKEGGGEIIGTIRAPLMTQDFTPYMQRVKDQKPESLMIFVPAGKTATQLMKAFGDLGLPQAGIKLIGPGDITTDEELPGMGDTPLGVITAHHYSSAGDRPANKAFVAAWKKEYGEKALVNFVAVAAWDGMDAIYTAIREQKGVIDPEKTMEIWKKWSNPDSPRGPISIDPATRDIVQNIYLREVRKVGGQLINFELETIGTAVKDPFKEFKK